MKKLRKLVSILMLATVVIFAAGCTKPDEPNNGNGTSEVPNEYQLWTQRAEQIIEGCTTDYEKAKAIYEWECANIAYDTDLKIYSAEECWNQRKGVCQAYSELFVKLASHCGLQAMVVQGEARTLNYPNGDAGHAWVKVNTEKGWILVDPTWGAGYVSLEGFIFYEKNISWFDADPELMIFTHYPDVDSDQMLIPAVTKSQYRDLPLVEPVVSQAGWKGHDILTYFLGHLGESAPLFYVGFIDYAGSFKLVDMPYCGNLKVGQTYTLKILSLDGEHIVTSNPRLDWEQEMVEEGVLYQSVFRPESEGDILIFLDYCGIMKYDVVQ